MSKKEMRNGVGRKMLSYEIASMAEAILTSEEVDEAVEHIVKKYAKESIDAARRLLSQIVSVSDIAIQHKEREVEDVYDAAHWLMVYNSLKLRNEPNVLFVTMVPVCKAMFKSGTAEGRAQAEKDYFNKFLNLFKDKDVFTWEREGAWADMCGYTDYLELVEKKMKKAMDDVNGMD